MGLNPVPKVFCGSSLGLILNNIVSILVVLVGVTYNFLGWYGLDPLKKASLSPPYLYYIKIFSGGADCSGDGQAVAPPHPQLHLTNKEDSQWDPGEARRRLDHSHHQPQHRNKYADRKSPEYTDQDSFG